MSGFDVFDDDGNPAVDPLDPFGTAKAEEERADRLQRNAETTNEDGKITVKTFGEKLAEDEESGASIRVDDGEMEGSFDEEGGGVRIRASKINADTGTALGPVKFSAHGPEAEGYGSASSGKTGLGGHLDVAGVDAQIGDDGTHVKGGVSLGLGLGAEFATGDDSDGDGYGEWGMRGEGGPLSASVRFEPGAVADGASEMADTAPGLAQDFADDPEGTLQRMNDAIDEDASDQVEDASALRYLRDELGDALGSATDPLGGVAGGFQGGSTVGAAGGLPDSLNELLVEDTFTSPAPSDGPTDYEVTPPADANFTAPAAEPEYIETGPVDTYVEPEYIETGPVDTYVEPEYIETGPVETYLEEAYVEPPAVETYVEPEYIETGPVDTYLEEAYVEPPAVETYAEPAAAEETYAEEPPVEY